MALYQRSYAGEADLQDMAALAHETAADNLHVVDLPYRFSSWAFDQPDSVQLWFDAADRLAAWAVLQPPFWTIDYVLRRAETADVSLHSRVMAWADKRARHIVGTPYGHPMWFVNVFAEQADRIRDLQAAGFADQGNAGDRSWSQVLMRRPGDLRVDTHARPLPPGYVIRPLQGAPEVDACVELHRLAFGSRNMTPEWRRRTLQRPEYRADLDLVMESPDGQLAAFGLCWFDPAGRDRHPSGQVEPMGVHPDLGRQGLGRAILAEGIRRLLAMGAQQVFVQADNNSAAFGLYQSTGFQVFRDVRVFGRTYEEVRRPGDV